MSKHYTVRDLNLANLLILEHADRLMNMGEQYSYENLCGLVINRNSTTSR